MIALTVNLVVRFLLFFICRVDSKPLRIIPKKGPYIIVTNHINFLDAPVGLTYLYPRQISSLVKKETFNNPILRFLFNTWGSIPVERWNADFEAAGKAIESLRQGKIFLIAPEGTRTRDGKLIQGQPGLVFIALKSKVPILPIVQFGAENFDANVKRMKRTRINFVVGKPFRLELKSNYPSKEERLAMTDEVMYQMAQLLPEENRGYYADLSKATTEYLNFDVPELKSNQSWRQKISNTLSKYFPTAKNPAT